MLKIELSCNPSLVVFVIPFVQSISSEREQLKDGQKKARPTISQTAHLGLQRCWSSYRYHDSGANHLGSASESRAQVEAESLGIVPIYRAHHQSMYRRQFVNIYCEELKDDQTVYRGQALFPAHLL